MDSSIPPYSLDAPPCRALRGIEPKSFAQTTFKKRLPVTLTNVIDDVHRSFCELPAETADLKIQQGKDIVHALSQLRHHIQRDKSVSLIEDDLPDVGLWQLAQDELDHSLDLTYWTLTWLFSECLVYRVIHGIISAKSEWVNYDAFQRQKVESFTNVKPGIVELATRINPLMQPGSSDTKLMFFELIQLSLWGNQADLSLLNDISAHEEIFSNYSDLSTEKLSSHNAHILSDHTHAAYVYVETLKDKRIDIVLDNSGFELFNDFLLADWLIQNKHANHIRFHAKSIPWFVSDVTRHDFEWMLDVCCQMDNQFIRELGERWSKYYWDQQVWELDTHSFWTTPFPYWHLSDVAPDLHQDLTQSSLLIFKGDLNYRKLVYDCDWPLDTSFTSALGPLGPTNDISLPHFPPILALRTLKSDPVVGLERDMFIKTKDLDRKEPDWRFSGKYGLIQFRGP